MSKIQMQNTPIARKLFFVKEAEIRRVYSSISSVRRPSVAKRFQLLIELGQSLRQLEAYIQEEQQGELKF